MKISAVIITFNEEKYLERCLNQLAVCDQLIVVDLGSDDRSPEIAKQFATNYFTHKWEPLVEYVLPDILDCVENDWVIWADPDEIFPEQLLKEIGDITSKTNDFAQVEIPFQFYFLGKPLKKSVWGGKRYFNKKLFNMNRVRLLKNMNKAVEVCEPYTIGKIEWTEVNAVRHYWIDSYSELFQKHNRYLLQEGKSRYNRGEKFSIKYWLYSVVKAAYDSFFRRRGIIGNFSEIFLSFFYVWYISKSIWELRKFSKAHNSTNHSRT